MAATVREGFLNVLKPPGMTSHDVVALLRDRLGIRRAGHLGTLDPAAAGVLPVAFGRATRLFRFAGGPDKEYRAEVTFGITTDTLDAEGEIQQVCDSSGLAKAELRGELPRFIGEIEQTPPAFSAARVDGQRLHELARRGAATTARPRRVRITRLELLAFEPGPRARALLDVECSAGTYLRALAAELGRAVGCGAYLSFLVRTRVGRFIQSDALSLEEIEEVQHDGRLDEVILPADWPLAHLAAIDLDAHSAQRFCAGECVLVGAGLRGWVRTYGPGGQFLGLGESEEGRQLRPRLVIAGEEAKP